jgi:hypothetical protein
VLALATKKFNGRKQWHRGELKLGKSKETLVRVLFVLAHVLNWFIL